jgi:hypothetical protein
MSITADPVDLHLRKFDDEAGNLAQQTGGMLRRGIAGGKEFSGVENEGCGIRR